MEPIKETGHMGLSLLAVTVAQGTEFMSVFKNSGSIGLESKKQFIVMFNRLS